MAACQCLTPLPLQHLRRLRSRALPPCPSARQSCWRQPGLLLLIAMMRVVLLSIMQLHQGLSCRACAPLVKKVPAAATAVARGIRLPCGRIGSQPSCVPSTATPPLPWQQPRLLTSSGCSSH